MFQFAAMSTYWKQSLRGVPWNQLKSGNIETLYILSALKEPVQIYYKKACSYEASMNINILQTYLWKISLIRFMALVSFYNPWNVTLRWAVFYGTTLNGCFWLYSMVNVSLSVWCCNWAITVITNSIIFRML